MSDPVLLVRHPPVARAWAGRCYGRSDMGWSRDGAVVARDLVVTLARRPIATVVHSGARRTRRLAAMLAVRTRASLCEDERWLERDFGAWEGRRWDAIWRETGDLMDRMMTHPHCFRPGGGETTDEMALRARAAWTDLPGEGMTVVIAHGGPIAAIRAWLAGASTKDMTRFLPGTGTVTSLC